MLKSTMNMPPVRAMQVLRRLRALALGGLLAVTGATGWIPVRAGQADGEPTAAVPPMPHFQEVLRLLRTHLPGVTEAELNAAIIKGLTGSFGSRVLWMSETNAPAVETAAGLRRTAFYGEGVGYLGVERVVPGLADELAAAKTGLRSSNEITGWVLDLRFSGGRDFRAAALAADQFVKAGRPLLRYDEEEMTSTGEGDADCPLVVVVNSETEGAAEALAGALREAGPVVVLGSRTAGRAQALRAFDLEQGGRLLIAGAPVQVGSGVSLEQGVTPDFEASIPLAEERLWLDDPYRVPEGESLATVPADRINEAALVAQHGGLTNSPAESRRAAPVEDEKPKLVLRDPALVRALSLLKGLARVHGGLLR